MAALGLAALAVVGMGAVGVRVVTGDDSSTVRQDAPVAEAPAPASPGDFVPGTDIDEKLAAVVAAQLPALPAPDDVYPSDSHTPARSPTPNGRRPRTGRRPTRSTAGTPS